MNRKLLAVLRALTEQSVPGPLEARLEAAVDKATDAVLVALAEDMARGTTRSANTLRSSAIRALLKRGAQGMLDDARVDA